MKMTFENLGPIARGNLELADLTILCGQNNTGKTYVTYALYCLLKSWVGLTRIGLTDEIQDLNIKGVVQIDIEEKIINAWPEISKKVLADFADAFPSMMASQGTLFDKTTLDWTFTLDDQWKKRDIKDELRNARGELLLTIAKPAGSHFVEVTAAKLAKELISGYGISDFLSDALVNIVLADVMPEVFMASSERTGATIFRRDLNLAKNSVVDLLAQLHKDGSNDLSPGKAFATLYKRNYARPVDDNVRFANALPGADSESGSLVKEYPELLEYFAAIVGGQYVTNKDGATHFQPAKTKLKLGLGETSSAVRSLLIVWYWLKYQAKAGGMLMIDEPELNLHPDNQRRLARFLARLVNLGVRVFITTHSDTIVREFNTLLMLSRNLPHFANVRLKNGYAKDENLSRDKVVLYITGEAKFEVEGVKNKRTLTTLLKVIPDPKLGLDVKAFDQTILDMSQIQDDLRYGDE